MGAWIEICNACAYRFAASVAPCVGAWIEMVFHPNEHVLSLVAPCVGAWIEIIGKVWNNEEYTMSHPVWVCELKSVRYAACDLVCMSHPV